MSRKIIIISHGAGFMVNAIANALKLKSFEVVSINPDLDELDGAKSNASYVLLYLGVYVYNNPEIISKLWEVCRSLELKVIAVGTDKELAEAGKYLPQGFITRQFTRPVEIPTLVQAFVQTEQADAGETRPRVLLVDDDPTFLKMIKNWLDEDYQVTIVSSGAQAMLYVADHTPDLILLDFDMPVVPGPKVLEMLRSESKTASIPVIFLTGRDDRESVLQVLALKPQGYVLKSSDRRKLLQTLHDFFQQR